MLHLQLKMTIEINELQILYISEIQINRQLTARKWLLFAGRCHSDSVYKNKE